MNKYLEAEKRLAELMGYKEIFRLKVDGVEQGGLHYNKNTFTGGEKVPRWTRDNAAAFALMVEHRIPINFSDTHTFVGNDEYGFDFAAYLQSDSEAAMRYAIVMAVIAKLEA